MSLPSNRPYKSRFFNFLNRYSIRFKEKAGVAWRNAAQTSVEWGVQILLYPVYLFVQAGRFAQRQLKQTARNIPRLIASRLKKETTAPLDDLLLPTERVLDAIIPKKTGEEKLLIIHHLQSKTPFFSLQEPSYLAISQTSNSSLVANSYQIQGIVSLIDSHRLAIVTTENVVLDILTNEQQKILEDRIRLEIANYWYEKRLRTKYIRKTPGLMPSFRKTWPNILPPVRWFWRIMRWEQTSDIAKEINLFGESSLVPIEPSPSELMPPQFLFVIDEKLAVIEEKDLISLTQWLQRTLMQSPSELAESPIWKIQVLIRAAVDYFFGQQQEILTLNKEQPILPGTASSQKILEAVKETGSQWLYTIGDRINNRLSDESTNPEADPFTIQVLIKSALSYYLALEEPKLKPQDIPQDIPQIPSMEPTEPDPWLSWQDLFTPATQVNQSVLETPSVTALPAASTPQLQKSQPVKIKEKATPKALRKVAPKPSSIAPVATSAPPVDAKKPQSVNESVNQPFPTSYNNTESDWPDWVEIKATPTGYQKHFLESLLGWFDQIILWIEELIIKIWLMFRHKKRNRKKNQR
ncbi:hypothetical protein C7H19_01375 [Aphanothece hegewaldii CCALA 016]|uniref:Uncharacterized protein n=1 Tax=Aphanothece hegewaldii CCALA 016 TaxID=2107694 RepID=A0A2T1M3P8_9CHRO|nr:hypothetical protein [Aphanothece hegewaldii]PSF39467.1 hypothetical protein C7H19_01375 [Aphanothece hegewaldii CCALA 016]